MDEYRARLKDLGALAASKIGSTKPWTTEIRQTPDGDLKIMSVKPPVYVSLESALDTASIGVRAALVNCSVLEHRALTTGTKEDVDTYFDALGELDAAMARLWDSHEIGATRKRVDVEDARQSLRDAARQLMVSSSSSQVSSESVAQRHDARAVYTQALDASSMPDYAIDTIVSMPSVIFEDKRENAVRKATGKTLARVAGKVAAMVVDNKRKQKVAK